jgi:hypothetical protein
VVHERAPTEQSTADHRTKQPEPTAHEVAHDDQTASNGFHLREGRNALLAIEMMKEKAASGQIVCLLRQTDQCIADFSACFDATGCSSFNCATQSDVALVEKGQVDVDPSGAKDSCDLEGHLATAARDIEHSNTSKLSVP